MPGARKCHDIQIDGAISQLLDQEPLFAAYCMSRQRAIGKSELAAIRRGINNSDNLAGVKGPDTEVADKNTNRTIFG